ncbi:MAG: DUF4625 domain-containing protein [Proteiniphilum sp.]|jgi:hypothetical protein|nr:DUF4625 domain-containing protein [Proteiniphilum sp.]
MKRKLFTGAMLLFSVNALMLFSSCERENKLPAPSVEITGLGSGHNSPDDRIAHAGSDVHLEAVITAEGLIREITVEVRWQSGNFRFGETYAGAKYAGVKNATFHEHVDVPADAPEGEYRLLLTVTDHEGQTASAESALTVLPESGEHDDDDL